MDFCMLIKIFCYISCSYSTEKIRNSFKSLRKTKNEYENRQPNILNSNFQSLAHNVNLKSVNLNPIPFSQLSPIFRSEIMQISYPTTYSTSLPIITVTETETTIVENVKIETLTVLDTIIYTEKITIASTVTITETPTFTITESKAILVSFPTTVAATAPATDDIVASSIETSILTQSKLSIFPCKNIVSFPRDEPTNKNRVPPFIRILNDNG